MLASLQPLTDWFWDLEWKVQNPIEVILLALATLGAWWFASRTNRIAAAKFIPIVTLEIRVKKTYARNIGAGVALNTCVTDLHLKKVYFRRHTTPR
jgi:hypothetical protein